MTAPKKTLYDILGVARDATALELGSAYEQRMAQAQAAAAADPGELALLREAYDVLGNPERRRAYDASLAAAAERAAAAQQRQLDLEVPAPPRRRPRAIHLAALAAFTALAILVLYLALRPERIPDPEARREAEAAAEAAKAAPPVPAPTPERSAAEILKAATASSGLLTSHDVSGGTAPIGIAVAVAPGAMVTTCHGIPAGRTLVVQVAGESLPAALDITDETLDLCRLSVAGLAAPALPVASEEPAVGDTVYATGVNSAGQFALTEGTVKQLRKAPAGQVIELSMPIASTGSGGGVFDRQGRLAGIATTHRGDDANASIALPATWIARMRSRGAPQ